MFLTTTHFLTQGKDQKPGLLKTYSLYRFKLRDYITQIQTSLTILVLVCSSFIQLSNNASAKRNQCHQGICMFTYLHWETEQNMLSEKNPQLHDPKSFTEDHNARTQR